MRKEFQSLKKEIILLSRLDHPNIVKYYQTDFDNENLLVNVVMELVPGGSLKRIVYKYKGLEETII